MTGKIHVTVGTVSLALLAAKYPTGVDIFGMHIIPAIGIITAAAGSYAPDIDMQRTHAGQQHKTASTVINKVGGGHRGITHTLLVPAIVAALMFAINMYLVDLPNMTTVILSILFGYEFGYVMHLFADMFNGKGIPLFWPIMRGKVHIMDFPSQGFLAWAWTVVFLGFMFVLTFSGVIA